MQILVPVVRQLDTIQTLGVTPDKSSVLLSHIDWIVYEFIKGCNTYEEAIQTLENIYVKPTNEIFARHLLTSRHQISDESIDQFLQALRELSADCNYKPGTFEAFRKETIRDVFINDQDLIQEKLLENRMLNFQNAYSLAQSLDHPQKMLLHLSNRIQLHQPKAQLPNLMIYHF